jgi:Domain of unknown function (DUF4404)
MAEQRLRELLHALHDELGRSATLDTEVEAELRDIVSEIRGALDRAETDAHAGLSERLSETLNHFETDHPRLALNVRRMLDAMSRL